MQIPVERTEYWDADLSIVPIYLILTNPIPKEKQDWLKQLINSWYEIGYYGAFGGSILDVSKVEVTERLVTWTVDFHGLPTVDAAISVLQICVENFANIHTVGIEKMTVGWADIK